MIGPATRTTLAATAGYVSAGVPMLAAYLSTLDGLDEIDWLKVLIGALIAVPAGGVAGTTYRAPSPVAVPERPVDAPRQPVTTGPVTMPDVTLPETSPFVYGKRSMEVLAELHPDLQRVMTRALALSPYDIALICGRRTDAEQAVLVATGKSQTHDSMHCRTPSHAVDFMVYGPDGGTWQVEPYYRAVNDAIREAARIEGVELTHGIDWKSLVDAGHVELRRSAYPKAIPA